MFVQNGIPREADVPQKMARLLEAQPLDGLFERKNRAALQGNRRSRATRPASCRRRPAGAHGSPRYMKAALARTGRGACAPAPAVPVRCHAGEGPKGVDGAHPHFRAAARSKDAVAQFLEQDCVALCAHRPELRKPFRDRRLFFPVVPLQLSDEVFSRHRSRL